MSNSGSEVLSPRVMGKLRRAERHLLDGAWGEADICFQSAVDLDESPVSQISYASSLADRERYHEAICLLTLAMERASSSGNREALGVVYHNLAAIYRELEDANLARRFQQKALLMLDDCGPEELLGLANDAWLSRRTELASCLAESCLELNEDNEGCRTDLEAQATVSVIGGIDNPRDAIRTLIQVYRQHCTRNEFRLAGIDLMNLSVLLGQLGREQAAASFVRRAIRHFDSACAVVSASRSRRVLAQLERIQTVSRFDPSRN